MFSIVNDKMQRLMAVDHFVQPNQPVFTDDVDEALIYETQHLAEALLAAYANNPAFGNCQVHNERPSHLLW